MFLGNANRLGRVPGGVPTPIPVTDILADSNIVITFSEEIDPATVTNVGDGSGSFELFNNTGAAWVAGALSTSDNIQYTFNPTSDFTIDDELTLTLTSAIETAVGANPYTGPFTFKYLVVFAIPEMSTFTIDSSSADANIGILTVTGTDEDGHTLTFGISLTDDSDTVALWQDEAAWQASGFDTGLPELTDETVPLFCFARDTEDIISAASISADCDVNIHDSYILRTDASASTPALLTDTQVLNTVAEGMVDGTMTVVDTDANSTARLASGKFSFFTPDGITIGSTALSVQNNEAASLVDGRVFAIAGLNVDAIQRAGIIIADASLDRLGMLYVNGNNNGAGSNDLFVYSFNPAGTIDGALEPVALLDATGVAYDFAIVVDDTLKRLFYFVGPSKGAKTLYAIMPISYADTEAYIKLICFKSVSAGDATTTIDNFKVPDVLDTGLITPATILTSSPQDAFADVLLEGKFTTPAVVQTPMFIKYRRSDAFNEWVVTIIPNTAGDDITLVKTVGGVPTSSLASADLDFAPSTEFSILITVDGDSLHTVLIDGVEAFSYTTPDTFNETSIGVSVINTAMTNVSIGAYARHGHTIDV